MPETYRQKFRNCGRDVNQTYVEFACEKEVPFDKWCQASKIADSRQRAGAFGEFKNCMLERIVVYLNKKLGLWQRLLSLPMSLF